MFKDDMKRYFHLRGQAPRIVLDGTIQNMDPRKRSRRGGMTPPLLIPSWSPHDPGGGHDPPPPPGPDARGWGTVLLSFFWRTKYSLDGEHYNVATPLWNLLTPLLITKHKHNLLGWPTSRNLCSKTLKKLCHSSWIYIRTEVQKIKA